MADGPTLSANDTTPVQRARTGNVRAEARVRDQAGSKAETGKKAKLVSSKADEGNPMGRILNANAGHTAISAFAQRKFDLDCSVACLIRHHLGKMHHPRSALSLNNAQAIINAAKIEKRNARTMPLNQFRLDFAPTKHSRSAIGFSLDLQTVCPATTTSSRVWNSMQKGRYIKADGEEAT